MKRVAAALALSLVLAGSAGADIFKVVPTTMTTASAPVALPSASVPNAPGSLSVPQNWLGRPSLVQQLDYGQLLGLWQRAGAAYGIQWQVLAAINKVESDFGRNMGPSSAGAIGWMQFMPSTWLRWGTDANGDGVADPWNAEDAIFSAARYLAASGGASDISRAVVRASGRLLAARRVETRLGKTVTRLDRRADQVSLLSDRLALQARAGHLRDVRASAAAVVAARQTALAAAATSLRKAQQAAA